MLNSYVQNLIRDLVRQQIHNCERAYQCRKLPRFTCSLCPTGCGQSNMEYQRIPAGGRRPNLGARHVSCASKSKGVCPGLRRQGYLNKAPLGLRYVAS